MEFTIDFDKSTEIKALGEICYISFSYSVEVSLVFNISCLVLELIQAIFLPYLDTLT